MGGCVSAVSNAGLGWLEGSGYWIFLIDTVFDSVHSELIYSRRITSVRIILFGFILCLRDEVYL